jgi:4-hydroxybenzoate polyprenyltransferase
LYAVAITIAFFINLVFLGIIALSVLLTASYSLPFVSLRSKFIINTMTGLVFYGILCPLAGWSIYSSYPLPMEMILFVFLLGSGIGITKDFEDIRGDSIFQIKTAPTTLGVRNASLVTGFLICISFVYLTAISVLGIVDIKYLAVLIFIPWVVYILYSLGTSKFENGYGSNNDKNFFIKNIFLAISVELALIAVTLI